jgi:hypothetical protein
MTTRAGTVTANVKEMQNALTAAGYPVSADGDFGTTTKALVLHALKELLSLRASLGGGVASFTSDDRATITRIEGLIKQAVAGQTTEAIDMTKMAATYKDEVARMTATIQQQTTVNASVLTLVQTFINQLNALGEDPSTADVAALSDAWEASLTQVQSAVSANTPAATTPPPA